MASSSVGSGVDDTGDDVGGGVGTEVLEEESASVHDHVQHWHLIKMVRVVSILEDAMTENGFSPQSNQPVVQTCMHAYYTWIK